MPAADDLLEVDIDFQPNEASGLLRVESEAVLRAHGWRLGFWTVLDEGRVEDCVVLLGRRDGATGPTQGWEIVRLEGKLVGPEVDTLDCEAVARRDGWVYVFGSHFGAKGGPLDPARAFVARFREDEATGRGGEVRLAVATDEFRLHRLVNDALRAAGVELLALGPGVVERFVAATRRRAGSEGRPWAERVREGDAPINVEGATFSPDGTLLVGLRFPVTADGHPIVVGLEGIERRFAVPPGEAVVTGLWVLDGIGRRDEMAGVRDLEAEGGRLHLLAGNLDATGVGSVVLEDHPEGRHARSAHWRVELPPGGGPARADLVREFAGVERMEGLASDGRGNFFYVSDEGDKVLTRFAQASLD